MNNEINLEAISAKLESIGIQEIKDYTGTSMEAITTAYGLKSHNIYLDMSQAEGINATVGVIVTYLDSFSNNGVYVFCVQQDGSVGLFVVEPSTIAKGPMISRITGEITDAITGVDMPPLTTFDKVEIVGNVIANTIINPLMDTLNIPESDRETFISIYLPRFMSNATLQYLGSSEIVEESVEIEPTLVKQMLIDSKTTPDHKEGSEHDSKDA